MTRLLLASAAALGLITGAAMAQSTTTATSTTGKPGTGVITPPSAPGTFTTSSTSGQMQYADGDKALSAGSGYSNDQGTSSDTIVSTKTYPLANLITTTKKTTQVNNGVATETTTVTQTYPPSMGSPGRSTTSETTRTFNVGSK